jgi:hypothetical protein
LGGISLLGIVVAIVLSREPQEVSRAEPIPLPVEIKSPPSPEEVAAPHLKAANEACRRAIDEHVLALAPFFAEAKQNTPSFAEAALSWGSKWRLIADHVPFAAGGRHEAYIRKKFEQHVFGPPEMERAITQLVRGYLTHVQSIEGRMLVDLRADVADFPETYLLAGFDDARLQKAYDQAITQAMARVGSSLPADIGGQLVSIIAGEVLAQVAIRIGVSAGILGSGAASSWATFGIGLVVGVIIDQIVAWVWDWWADPDQNLVAELNAKLDMMYRLLVSSLRSRLQTFAAERAKLRQATVLELLQRRE